MSNKFVEEREKKYLLDEIPPDILEVLDTITPLDLVQTYLKTSEKDQEWRVRSINNEKFVTTVKIPQVSSNGLIRYELEREITREEYDKCVNNLQIGKQIKKKRYILPTDNGLRYEIDVYYEDESDKTAKLNGLIVVEIEFPTQEMAYNFIPPKWFGDEPQEVTSDKRYKNASLAMNGMPTDEAPKRGSGGMDR